MSPALRQFAIATCCAALTYSAWPVFAEEGAKPTANGLSMTEIASQIVGNSIEFQNDDKDVIREYYDPNGEVRGTSKVNGNYKAVWQIRFGKYFCWHSETIAEENGCVQVVVKDPETVELHLDIGEIEGPYKLIKGNPFKL